MGVYRWAMVVTAALPAWGCLEVQSVVRVKADGSGTLVQTIAMNPQAIEAAMGEIGQAMGKAGGKVEGSGGGPMAGAFSPEKLKAEAAKLGEGVSFVSADPIDLPDRKGVRATYAFRDVSKLRLSQKPDGPEGASPPSGEGDKVVFRLEKAPAGHSVLVVSMGSPAPASKRPARTGVSETPPEALEMMKAMFKGMRVAIAVEVDGKVVKTNSPYVEGSRVTLLDIAFDALVSDPERLKQFEALDGAPIDEVKRLMQGLEGVKVNTEPEVRIEFAGK